MVGPTADRHTARAIIDRVAFCARIISRGDRRGIHVVGCSPSDEPCLARSAPAAGICDIRLRTRRGLRRDPTPEPTPTESASPEPSTEPASEPAAVPTPEPTAEPTAVPTREPSAEPTATPAPTNAPTAPPAPSVEPVAAPTISSDKDDYAPGELVTLTGTNWVPGETVHIRVNDDQGREAGRMARRSASECG